MAITPNQFAMQQTKGAVDQPKQGDAISCEVNVGESTALVPGQCVKIVDSAGGVPKITASTVATDDVFGVVPYDLRLSQFKAGERVEVLQDGAVVYMEASAAIARGAKVMQVVTGQKVATATSTNMIIGRAIDKAVNVGDLIRVRLDLPGVLAP